MHKQYNCKECKEVSILRKNEILDLSKYEKQWVALSQDESRVVANHVEFNKAINNARKGGEKRPIMVKVPSSTACYIL